MTLPKFVIGDNTDFSEGIFVIHLEYPRFVINLKDDEVEFLEDIEEEDEKELESEMEQNSWIATANHHENKIISKSTTHFWKEKIIELGGDYLIWSNAPDDPYLN